MEENINTGEVIKKKDRNIWKWVAIILIAMCFAITCFIGYTYLETSVREEGFELGVYSVALEQTKTGEIFYLNESSHLNTKPIGELCG